MAAGTSLARRGVTARRRAMRVACVLVALAAAGAAEGQAPSPRTACASAEHRQFDFWIGHWDVYLPNGNVAGENVISAFADGCALLESWTGRGGVVGKSLNGYDARDGRWHQTWVDSSGGRLELVGAWRAGSMVLTSAVGEPGKPGDRSVQRITWTPRSDGTVRQLWEASDDGGATWRVVFDGKYVRRK